MLVAARRLRDSTLSRMECERLQDVISWRQRARWFLGLPLAVGLVFALIPPLPAEAASNAVCDRTSVKVKWNSASNWTSSEKSTAMIGFDVWEWDIDKYNGASPVTISETSGTTIVDVSWLDITGYGIGLCDLNSVGFAKSKRNELNNDAAKFKLLAAHEMGHAIGLDHTHKSDSYDGKVPVMYSCVIGTSATYRPTQDDHAAMQIQTDPSGSFRSATANSSFEENTSYKEFWAIKSGSAVYRVTGGVDGTTYAMKYGHPSVDAYIYSTTGLIDDPSIDKVKARANYKKSASGDSGTVKVMLRVREYDVNGSSCGFPSRRSGSHTSYTASAYYSKICTVNSSWNYCTTGEENPLQRNAETGGVEVRVYVYNRMYNSFGGRSNVVVDRVRVLADY